MSFIEMPYCCPKCGNELYRVTNCGTKSKKTEKLLRSYATVVDKNKVQCVCGGLIRDDWACYKFTPYYKPEFSLR